MTVLIVEDEKTPRELLRDLVPWERHGFTQVDTARNGLEALEVLGARAVDLVITDVRMPKMDGVGLALEVRRRWPDCVLIFLSGFSDKEYLKTAIRVQAQDYLDKPIDLAVVGDAVAEAVKTIQQKQSVKDLGPLRRQAQALALLGLGPETSSPEPQFQAPPLRVIVLTPAASAPPEWKAAALALANGESSGFVAAPGPGDTVVVVCDRNVGADPAGLERQVGALMDRVEPSRFRLRAGLSTTVGPEGLKGAWAEAQAALGDAFYRPELSLHTVRPQGRTFELSDDVFSTWRSFMEARDYQGMARQFGLLEQRALSSRDPDHLRVRSVWLQGLDFLMEFVPSWGTAERAARTEKLRRDLEAAPDLASVAAVARECFDRLFLKSPSDLHVGDRVQKAQAYIEGRFADPDLTVDAIAGHVGFSESYFCTVFKQALGITVKDYVTRHRIEQAKACLWANEAPSLADLALRVGFRDPNYFSTVFKRLTGTTPGAYRKKALG